MTSLIKDNIDILIVTETKIDNTFPQRQFYIDRYNVPFHKDRTRWGWGSLFTSERTYHINF